MRIFHQKIGNQLKRTWHHMKVVTLKKPCVKFEERRLNILRENRICQKVNQNVNQERAARPPPATCPDITYLLSGLFLRKTRLTILMVLLLSGCCSLSLTLQRMYMVNVLKFGTHLQFLFSTKILAILAMEFTKCLSE